MKSRSQGDSKIPCLGFPLADKNCKILGLRKAAAVPYNGAAFSPMECLRSLPNSQQECMSLYPMRSPYTSPILVLSLQRKRPPFFVFLN